MATTDMAVADIEQWTDFFVAGAGASAALAGLVIVAISVNVQEILKYRSLPSRALATIGMLVLILVICMAALMPDQDSAALGVEILGFTLGASILVAASVHRGITEQRRDGGPLYQPLLEAFLGLLQIGLFVVAAIILLADGPGALYWVAAGMILVFVGTLINSWVLLIEILR